MNEHSKGEKPVLKIEEEIRGLIKRSALHKKKGIRLGQEMWGNVIEHLYEEVDEFDDAILNIQELEPKDKDEAVLEELGDILGILVHATIKAGFTMEQVEQRELKKLQERYV